MSLLVLERQGWGRGRDGLIKNLWESIFMKSQSSYAILLQPYCPSFLPSNMVSSSISESCFTCVCSAFTSLYNCSCFSFHFHMKNFLREFFADHSNRTLSVPRFLGCSSFTMLVTIWNYCVLNHLFACLLSVLAIWIKLHRKRDVIFLARYYTPGAKNHVWQIRRTHYILVRWMNNYRILI